MVIDTHAHLNDERLINEADEIAVSMRDDNLEAIINVGYDLTSSQISMELADKYDGIYASVGIHPHDAKNREMTDYDYFNDAAKNPKCVAIGEIGLDFYYDLSDRSVQKTVFLEQLELAHGLNKPVILHVRDAYGEILRLLRKNRHYLQNGAVLHCYMGSKEMINDFCDFDGMYFAFGGAITFTNAKKADIVKSVPLERLLLETDCPYMTPVPFRGSINYPKYVNLVKDKIEEWLLGVDVAGLTTKNAKALFKI